MNIHDYFAEQRKIKGREKQKAAIKSILLHIADKWIGFLALVVAAIALIRTF